MQAPPDMPRIISQVSRYSSRDLREYRLAHRLVLDQSRVFAGDGQIHLQERAFHVVENQAEQPRFAEHAPQQARGPAPCARPGRP